MIESILKEARQTEAEGAESSQPTPQVAADTTTAADRQGGESLLKKISSFSIEFGPGTKDILHFTNQLSVMVRAGISIQDALESVGQQQENKKFAAIIMDLKQQIEAGQSFSQALSAYPAVFSDIYVNMVAAAEVSGALSDMLEKLAGYLSQQAETRSQIKGAMIYPAVIAFLAVTAVIFLLCFVLPKFGGIFAGKEHMLPKPTKILMASSTILRGYWFLILPGVIGLFAGFWFFIGTKVGRIWWDRAKLKLPVIKTLCRCIYITRSLHTMSVLTHAGVPILDTIAITARISGNVLYRDMWDGVEERVREGKKIAQSLEKYKLMPPDVIQMIRSGEESGTMSEVLADISNFYGKELKNIIKAVTSLIEPIMIVVMGILVGFIAMSVMLPIFKMSNIVKG